MQSVIFGLGHKVQGIWGDRFSFIVVTLRLGPFLWGELKAGSCRAVVASMRYQGGHFPEQRDLRWAVILYANELS